MGYLDELIEALPIKKHRLPLYGFPYDSGMHVMVQILNFKEIWERMTKVSRIFILHDLWERDWFDLIFMKNIQHIIFGINFVGLQQMNYQGFTMYKDKRFSSYTSQLKYILNPNEFVIFGQPVHSMTDGKIVKIVDTYQDWIVREPLSSKIGSTRTPEDLYGNHVIIESNGVDYFYGGLQKNSTMRLRIGDTIRIGDEIGKVGCQGLLATFPFLHVHARLSAAHKRAFRINKYNLFVDSTIPIIKFEPFYEMPLITKVCNTPEAIDRFLVRDIKYTYNRGVVLYPGSFIKKI